MQSRRSFHAAVLPVLAISLALSAATPAAAGTVKFDNVPAAPGGTIYPGTLYAAKGVTFQSVSSPSAFVPNGGLITLSNYANRLMILGNQDSISKPNFAAASGVFGTSRNDVLMRFSAPIDSVSVVTDRTPETPDIVRLIALAPTIVPGKFVVVKTDQGWDNATMAPFNVLSLDLSNTPVSLVLFQVTTEAEGFDNLTWETAPNCAKTGGLIDQRCFHVPPHKEWVPTGCEIVDCCPLCPGPLDWILDIDGDPFETLVLRFEDLSPEVAAGLRVEGNATWYPDEQLLAVRGPGQVQIHGLALGRDPRWTAASPRMTVDRIAAPAGRGVDRAVRVKIHQEVGGKGISDSTLVYGF